MSLMNIDIPAIKQARMYPININLKKYEYIVIFIKPIYQGGFISFFNLTQHPSIHSDGTGSIRITKFRVCFRNIFLRDTSVAKSIFFILDPISRHNSKTPSPNHVFRVLDFDLKPAQIFENVPSPVLAKSYTGIGEIVYLFWPNHILVMVKSYTAID